MFGCHTDEDAVWHTDAVAAAVYRAVIQLEQRHTYNGDARSPVRCVCSPLLPPPQHRCCRGWWWWWRDARCSHHSSLGSPPSSSRFSNHVSDREEGVIFKARVHMKKKGTTKLMVLVMKQKKGCWGSVVWAFVVLLQLLLRRSMAAAAPSSETGVACYHRGVCLALSSHACFEVKWTTCRKATSWRLSFFFSLLLAQWF